MGSETLKTWKNGSQCDNFSKTAYGFETVPPSLEVYRRWVDVFFPDFCHKIVLDMKKDDIEKKRFTELTYNMGSPYPSANNWTHFSDCYCMENEGFDCYGYIVISVLCVVNVITSPDIFSDGAINLGPCGQEWIGLRGGMNGLVMTRPHFLGQHLMMDKVDGMNPQEDKHKTYLEMEPKLGITTGYKFRYKLLLILS